MELIMSAYTKTQQLRRGVITRKMRTANLKPSRNYKAAKARAWKYFSEFVRLRDSRDKICVCITCGKMGHWKKFHAGHCITRDKAPTFLDEKNVNAQCRRCNTFQAGKQAEHAQAIDKKHGDGTFDKLLQKSKLPGNFTLIGLDDLAALYKLRAEEILNKGEEIP